MRIPACPIVPKPVAAHIAPANEPRARLNASQSQGQDRQIRSLTQIVFLRAGSGIKNPAPRKSCIRKPHQWNRFGCDSGNLETSGGLEPSNPRLDRPGKPVRFLGGLAKFLDLLINLLPAPLSDLHALRFSLGSLP